jgi:XTP/dITP diphosphohydrolase
LSSPTLLIATTNSGKFREFSQLLGDLPLRLASLAGLPGAPAVAEEGETYAANATHKALSLARWSGCATLADDSGLEVDALRGAPGVHSARYAGVEQDSGANLHKLLQALDSIPPGERTARFRCVIVVACPNGATLLAEGSCEGRILEAPQGRSGFGYDPVFFYPPLDSAFAEVPAAVKNRVSHRAQACTRLRRKLLSFLSAHADACTSCKLD